MTANESICTKEWLFFSGEVIVMLSNVHLLRCSPVSKPLSFSSVRQTGPLIFFVASAAAASILLPLKDVVVVIKTK